MSNSSLVSYTKISPNRTSPRNHKIDTITIHCVVGQCSVEALGNVFAPTSKRASSNYGIGFDGKVGLYVEEKDRSWCSSSKSNDNRAITIEVASDTTHPYAVNDRAYAALIELLVDICKRNGIKELKWKADKSLIGQVDKQNMTVHRWFANKACPGDYLYKRHGEIAAEVNCRLSATVEKPNKLYKIQVGAFSKKANADAMLAKVKAAGFNAFITTEAGTAAGTAVSTGVTFAIGDKVKLTSDARMYGSSIKFSSWVYSSTLYVREISGARVVISTQKTGAITGAVDKKYLTKV